MVEGSSPFGLAFVRLRTYVKLMWVFFSSCLTGASADLLVAFLGQLTLKRSWNRFAVLIHVAPGIVWSCPGSDAQCWRSP